ncbi:DUF1707 SHOCT-like domain-containing protein [Microlunatus elymi]|uniref:DUF1707 SHOCT-like domain-containing protein n=1 Tax=Microlunatus elymi TaxID=2596828 RepID=UPI00143D23F8|nr:DUF1707 domain-containing protein [Microlunatus elymi]
MSNWSQPVPQRIGDAERDQAAEFLREHHAQGRLDAEEFDERVTAALTAKWQSDLDRLFLDLPAPTPRTVQRSAQASAATASAPRPPKMSNVWPIAAAAIWPLTIALFILSKGEAWFLILAAIALTTTWHRRRGLMTSARFRYDAELQARERAERRRLEAERRRLDDERRKWDPPA